MLNRLTGVICAALLGVLMCFYGTQIWYSSTISAQTHAITLNDSTKIRAATINTLDAAKDRIADYTWWLSAFTLVIGVVGLGQVYFLIRADQTARIMAEIAQAQTAKMGEWADSAAKQMLIVARQTDIQEKQHAIGRLQFFACIAQQ